MLLANVVVCIEVLDVFVRLAIERRHSDGIGCMGECLSVCMIDRAGGCGWSLSGSNEQILTTTLRCVCSPNKR